MLPSFHVPTSHAENVYEPLPSSQLTPLPNAHPEHALSEGQCRELLEQVSQHSKDTRTIRSFLQSTDPAARLDGHTRAALLDQCDRIADSRYLEDVWPAAATGRVAASAHRPLPAFRLRHQTQTQQNAEELKTLTALVIELADAKLAVFLRPLKQSLETTEYMVNQLLQDCNPMGCNMARTLIECVEKRSGAGTLEGCRIATFERALRGKNDMLDTTQKALEVLLQLRTGNGDTVSFSMAQHPDFYAEWQRAMSDMEKMQWTSFKSRVDKLTTWREQLLPDALPVKPFRL